MIRWYLIAGQQSVSHSALGGIEGSRGGQLNLRDHFDDDLFLQFIVAWRRRTVLVE